MDNRDNKKTESYLGYDGVAKAINTTSSTVRAYWAQGRLPEPDVMIGSRPGWKEETVTEWNESRPGVGYRSDLKKGDN